MARQKKCVRCKEKVSNRPGGLCYGCWKLVMVAAGTPVVEELAPGGNPNGAPPPDLPSIPGDLLDGMHYVVNHREDRTVQHWELRQWKTRNEDEFMDKYTSLDRARRIGAAGSVSAPQSQPSSATAASHPDSGLERIIPLLPDWEEVKLIGEHPGEFREWLQDREEFRTWKAQKPSPS